MLDKGEPPPTRRKPPDRHPGVLDRPLMERDLFAPDRSRILPPISHIPKRKGSSPATGTALGTSGAEPPPSAEPAPLPRRNLASRRRTPPEIDNEELQEERRLKASATTTTNTPTPLQKQPVTRDNSPPD
ncbi:unnamed protein product [Parnassius apollo]|uniref:(apollo) hypothetical protein n=1 Tax=Parnassius apollo TaxID=110799 RepID=A0A8S3XNA5_PARAO|nr:unnamed protein product [Parnassius apollo]